MGDMEPSASTYLVAFVLFGLGLTLMYFQWFYLGGALMCAGGSSMCLFMYMDQAYHDRRRHFYEGVTDDSDL